MSRLGKRPIEIPDSVEVKQENGEVVITGPEGTLSQQLLPGISLEIGSDSLLVNRKSNSKRQKSYHGLIWSLLGNMVEGVTDKFTKTLVLKGLGYRARMQGEELHIELGYSNVCEVEIPEGISVELPNRTTIIVEGIDKQQVGQFAARLRELRSPDPYNQKGIKYEGEYIRQKVGKTVGGEGSLGD